MKDASRLKMETGGNGASDRSHAKTPSEAADRSDRILIVNDVVVPGVQVRPKTMDSSMSIRTRHACSIITECMFSDSHTMYSLRHVWMTIPSLLSACCDLVRWGHVAKVGPSN